VTLVPLVVTLLCCSHWTRGSSCCTGYISLVALCWTLVEGSEHFRREFLLHTQTLFRYCHQKMEIAWRGMWVMLIRPVTLSLMQGIFEWGWL
jgi:predicted metal-dependent hydrolase